MVRFRFLWLGFFRNLGFCGEDIGASKAVRVLYSGARE